MPSLIATFGGNISPLVKSMEEAKLMAKLTGSSIRASMSPEAVAQKQNMWAGLLAQKDLNQSFMGAGALGDWKTKVAGIQRDKAGMESGPTGFGSFIGKATLAVAAAIAVEEAIRRPAMAMVDWGSHIYDLSLRLGLSTGEVQAWDYALKQNGSTIDAAIPFFEKLAVARKKALSGNEDSIAGFAKLGASLNDLKKMSLGELGAKTGENYLTKDPAEVSAMFKAIGIKGAGELATAFGDGLKDAFEEFKTLKLEVSPDALESLDAFGDSWTKLSVQFKSVAAPIVAWVADLIGEFRHMSGIVQTLLSPITFLWSIIKNFDSGDLAGSFKRVADDLMKPSATAEEIEAEKAALTSKRERIKSRVGKEKESDESQSTGAKERDKELDQLKKQTDEEERRGKMALLTDTQKLEALREEVALLEKKASIEKDPVEKAKLGLELAKRKNEFNADELKLKKQAEDDADKLSKAKSKAQGGVDSPAEKEKSLREEIKLLKEKYALESDPHKKSEIKLEQMGKIGELAQIYDKENKDRADAQHKASVERGKILIEDAKQKKKDAQTTLDALDEADRLANAKQAVAPGVGSSVSSIGGFLGAYQAAPEVVMLDVQKKSEGHLLAIKNSTEAARRTMERIAARDEKYRGVQY